MNLQAMQATADDLREGLPIPFVMSYYGYEPEMEGGGRLHYVNPWRDDDNPSLDVFTNDSGAQRAGDFASGFQGDVFDIIGMQIESGSFVDQLKEARELYAHFLTFGYEGPELQAGRAREIEEDVLREMAMAPMVTTSSEAAYTLVRDTVGVDFDTLIEFDVRERENDLAVIYPDQKAIRIRRPDGSKIFVSGSKPSLYHLPGVDVTQSPRILLVEGESDTWAAHAAVGDEYLVVGIPGVGHQPSKHAAPMSGAQEIVIAFDGDPAGRSGAMNWADHLRGLGASVQIVPIPDDEDVASLTTAEFRRLVSSRRPLVRNTSGMEATAEGYGFVTPDPKGEKEATIRYVSNFTLRPLRLLQAGERSRTYEVEALMGGVVVRQLMVTQEDMSTSAKLNAWASQFSGSWFGGPLDGQRLQAALEEQSTFVPMDQATDRPGLLDQSYVWPGGSTGGGHTYCLPNPQNPLDETVFVLKKGGPRPSITIDKLLGMREDHVMEPIIAWLAIAPLRALYKQFPVLFVPGRSGSGKTTLLEETLPVFSGLDFVTNLTSTTPYAVTLTMGATNAFPVWFDEYRPGAAKSTIHIMDQLIRDAFNKAPSRRGGMGSDKTKVSIVTTDNPLIVSGEDFADEQSHRDRMIKVFVPKEGKGELPVWDDYDRAFAIDYLQWLTERPHGIDPAPVERPPVIDPSPYTGVSNRQAYNLAVLDAGWSLLRRYLADRAPDYELGDADWSDLLARSREEAASDPILEQLYVTYEGMGNSDVMWVDRDGALLYVSPGQILEMWRQSRQTLPFTTTSAMKGYLVDALGGKEVRRSGPTSGGRRLRYIALPNPFDNE